jgi:Tol biopolymer transport system component
MKKPPSLMRFWLRLAMGIATASSMLLAATMAAARATPRQVVAYAADVDLFAMDVNTALIHRLTGQAVYPGILPAWSPDGSALAFSSPSEGGLHLYVVDVFNGEVRQLTDGDTRDLFPVWSPDGRTIAYAREIASDAQHIFLVDVADGDMRQLTDRASRDRPLAWTPDGQQLLVLSDGQGIYRLNPDGANLQWLSDLPASILGLSYSPDRRTILFGSVYNRLISVITSLDVDTGETLDLTQDAAFDRDPSWSPDGTQIAFASNRDGDPEIYVMAADGGSPRQLTHNARWPDMCPSWSPDGSHILFTSIRQGNAYFSLHIMDADGSNEHQVGGNTNVKFLPSRQPCLAVFPAYSVVQLSASGR